MNLPAKNLKYCTEAIDLKKDIERNFVVLAEYLYHIRKDNLFEPQWSSFVEFCYELKMSPNMAHKLVQIYETFVLQYKFSNQQLSTAGGWAVLQEILPVVKTKKEATKWLMNASLLTRSDLRKELTEHKTGVDMTKCKHKDTYSIEICRDCGDRQQIK